MTQTEKILEVLNKSRGQWINGRHFLREMYISQYHARIKELEEQGIRIEHSDFKDEFGFVSYRIPAEINQPALF